MPSNYDAAVLADSPFGYWKCQETSGTTLVDTAGHSGNLSIVGSPTLGVAGILRGEYAISWPANTGVYATGNPGPSTAANSYEAWLYMSSYPSGITPMLSNADFNAGWGNTEGGFGIDSSGRPWVYGYDNNQGTIYGSALPLNKWLHIVASCPAYGTSVPVTIYVNGQVNTTQNNQSIGTGRHMKMHAGWNNQGGAFAAMCYCAVYGRALTQAQAYAHYNAMTVNSIFSVSDPHDTRIPGIH